VVFTSEGLKIRADIYGRSVPASSLVKEGARRLDFSASSELLPSWDGGIKKEASK
jgi:hypothetical protein